MRKVNAAESVVTGGTDLRHWLFIYRAFNFIRNGHGEHSGCRTQRQKES